jgi:rhodanese-related sulfurtransferase
MKNLKKYFLLIALIPALLLSSCKKDAPDAPDVDPSLSFKALKTYLVSNNMDLPNVLDSWITTADAVNTVMTDTDATNDFYIIDIRAAADYDAGHIAGAVNATLGTLLNQASSNGGKPILVACYTGQTASHAVVALRLSGYPTAKVLKWGMASWNSNLTGSWDANTGDNGAANWTAAPGNITGNTKAGDPEYTTTATDGAAILTERVAAMLSGGFKGVAGADVAGTPSNYFINNYWAVADVEHYGHIAGAYRISPLTLAGGEYQNLDPKKQIVTYCWTGQTSSMITAYLNVLGYDAVSLKFGANNLIYSALASHKWSASETRDYPVVVSGAPAQGILTDYLVANDMDLNEILAVSWITSAEAVQTIQTDADATNDYYIIDIRSATDFANGHIDGAVNSTLADVITTAGNANGKTVLVACYTGQTAGHAVMALRLSGFADAKVLKWGMSSWDISLAGSWNSNTGSAGNVGTTHTNWTAAPGALVANSTYDAPSISSAATSGEGILAERVTYMLANGLKGIKNTDVLDTPSNYFINNYWATTDIEHYGHITGAHRVQPLSIEGGEILNLDPAKTVVTYCWTSQTSSMITAYLTVVGYDAQSLKFGANGMIYDALESHKWSDSEAKGYPLVASK